MNMTTKLWWLGLGTLALVGCEGPGADPEPAPEASEEALGKRKSARRAPNAKARRAARKRQESEALRQQLTMLGYVTEDGGRTPVPVERPQGRAAQAPLAMRAPSKPGSTQPVLASLRLRPSLPEPPPPAVAHEEPTWSPPPGHTLTVAQPFTTLAADVDDASWVRARARRAAGLVPDAAEVRLEEFVNAMPYHYPDPVDGDFGVTTERVGHPEHPDWELVRVGVQGRRLALEERPPLNLTFLIDTSGSMQGPNGLDLAVASLRDLADQLGPDDTLSVVTFAVDADVELPATSMDPSGRKAFRKVLDRLVAGGGTGMSLGLDLAYDEALRNHRPGTVSRVVLVSDGDANVGMLSGDEMARLVGQRADDGVWLTALGVNVRGSGDEVLEALSNQGDGQYFALADARDARRTLVDDVVGTFVPLARDVKLQVEWDPEVVRSHHMLGYVNRTLSEEQFRQDAVDGGEVGMGHQVTALFVVRREPDTESRALGVLRLRSETPFADAVADEAAFVLHGPRAERPADASADTVVAMAAATLGSHWTGEPLLPLEEVLAPLRRAIDPELPEHKDLLDAIQEVASGAVGTAQGPSGVVSMQTEVDAFDRIRVRCGSALEWSRFTGGRAVVDGLPDGPCVADLGGGRPTVSVQVIPGESYRCDGEPLRCRLLQ